MDAGSGLRLFNPDPLDPDADFVAFSLPVIYVWGPFWYVVQFAVILYAYKYLWREGEDL